MSHEHHGILNHQQLNCLLNGLFMLSTKKTSQLCILAFCEGNPPATGGFHSQRTSNATSIFLRSWSYSDLSIARGPHICLALWVTGHCQATWCDIYTVNLQVKIGNFFKEIIKNQILVFFRQNEIHCNLLFLQSVLNVLTLWALIYRFLTFVVLDTFIRFRVYIWNLPDCKPFKKKTLG